MKHIWGENIYKFLCAIYRVLTMYKYLISSSTGGERIIKIEMSLILQIFAF